VTSRKSRQYNFNEKDVRVPKPTIVVLDGDNHLFQHLLPGDVSDGREYFQFHPIDARVATAITQWLREHISK